MASGKKLRFLAMSLLLPAVLAASTHLFVTAMAHVGDDDRAIVWVDGSPQAVSAARDRLAGNDVFSAGHAEYASSATIPPSECARDAVELSFANLDTSSAQAAREELEQIAEDSGLRVCASNLFRINDASTATAAHRSWFAAQYMLLYLVVPGGICLLLYAMFCEQLSLPSLRPQTPVGINMLQGLAAALVLFGLVSGIRAALGLPWQGTHPGLAAGMDTVTIALVIALMSISPAIEELAYRGWMIPLAERATGAAGACVLSTLAFVASYRPDTAEEALVIAALGTVCAVLYVRTRSLVAPIVAHAGFALLSLAASTAMA